MSTGVLITLIICGLILFCVSLFVVCALILGKKTAESQRKMIDKFFDFDDDERGNK